MEVLFRRKGSYETYMEMRMEWTAVPDTLICFLFYHTDIL